MGDVKYYQSGSYSTIHAIISLCFCLKDQCIYTLVMRVSDAKQNNHIHYSGLKCLETVIA